ncbi:MAG: hypothetical protein ISR40_08785 [Puniceicoccaceae bacterium]|jgi:hypothetical protein|nr:hypothetical protein [Puniceicoccaceae bacterium]
MMKLFAYIVSILALPVILLAQDQPERVRFDFRCLAMSEELRMKEFYVGSVLDSDRQQIRLNDLTKTETYSYSGAPLLYFYDQAEGGKLVASYRHNPALKAPLLIFVASGAGASPAFNVFSIEDSWSELGTRSCLLVNLTSKALYWKFGDERFRIDPKAQRRIDSGDEAKIQVIALEADENGKPARVYRAYLHNLENMRRILFVRDTTEDEVGSVRVKVIEDFYVPQEASGDDSGR